MKFGNKKPEKIPMYVYYIIAGVIIVLLNMLVVPAVQERSVQKTDYSTFIENVEDGNVTKATVEENYIYYEMKDSNSGNMVLCKTVKMDDSDLVNRLLDAGVTMDEVLPESPSILMTLLLSYVVPIVIFIFIGRWLSKKIMSSMGGGPGGAMSFGKSNAKVYVKSSTGIKFSDVAGEDEAKDRSLIICIIRRSIQKLGRLCQRVHCLWVLLEQVRLFLPRQLQVKLKFRFSLFRDLSL